MDPSLAKGIKNQLFREIDEDIGKFIKKWSAYVKNSQPQKSKSSWARFSKGIESLYGRYMLANYFGGTERRPYICISTFENLERPYNSWNERCFSSKNIYFNFDPIGVNSEQVGFNISEHAIQRIFERSYSDSDPLAESFLKIDFTNELRMAPLWSFFWSLILIEENNASNKLKNKIDIYIPSVSGLLLGEVSTLNFHKCEIRTFISRRQFSEEQAMLWDSMLEISKKYLKSVIPFLYSEFIYSKPGSQDCLAEFILDTQDLRRKLGSSVLRQKTAAPIRW